jgi:hypothetical protein
MTSPRVPSYTILLIILAYTLSVASLHAKEPAHLSDLRLLLETVTPDNTSYRHRDIVVAWRGRNGAEKSVSHADCSGLIDRLLEHSYGYSPEQLREWLGGRHRPLAANYYHAILDQNGFHRITKIGQILPGDFIAMKYLPGHGDKHDDTGHVMMIDARPQQISSNIQQYQRWSVEVIDSSGGHGRQDTRFRDSKFHSGLGKGYFSLYTNSDGTLVGYSWTTSDSSKFYDDTARPLVVGRLIK